MVPYLISLGSRSATDTLGCRFPMSDHDRGARGQARRKVGQRSVLRLLGDKRSYVSGDGSAVAHETRGSYESGHVRGTRQVDRCAEGLL